MHWNVALLLVVCTGVVFAQNLVYVNDKYVFTASEKRLPFLDALIYCRSLPRGEMALIKDRDLAKQIEMKIIAIGKGK